MGSKEYNKTYREKHREVLRKKDKERYENQTEEQYQKRLASAKKSYLKNKSKVLIRARHTYLQNTYKITSEDYLKMMIEQKNKCAICEQYERQVLKSGDIKPLAVDHNHSTGEVRQLLCHDCNAMLGYAKENANILNSAISYLEYHN